MRDLVLGVDLGATKILTGIISSRGEILFRSLMPTNSDSQDAGMILDRMAEAGQALTSAAGIKMDELRGVAVASPGPISPEGVVTQSPNLRWKKVRLKDELELRWGRAVVVGKDTNLAALGEMYFGGHVNCRHLLYMTVSTGIGGGIIAGGRVYGGRAGGAGEVGHMVVDPQGRRCGCGRQGCLEAMASGTAIAAMVREMTERGAGRGITALGGSGAREVGEAARLGDPEAAELLQRVSQSLGIGIANLVNIFNPDTVVLGGSVIQGLQDIILEPVRKYVQAQVLNLHREALKIELTRLGADIGLYGCLAAVLENESRGNIFE